MRSTSLPTVVVIASLRNTRGGEVAVPYVTRRDSRGQGQADFSAEQPPPGPCARFPSAHADPCRPGHRVRAARQGSPFSDCLIRSGLRAVLPARNRMTRSTDFGVTVRQGVRAVQPDLVVHALRGGSGDSGDRTDGPKIGLVVSKSVGTAVQRHRVSRRLRHVARAMLGDLDVSDRVVIRALPGSRDALSARLESELRVALKHTRITAGAGS